MQWKEFEIFSLSFKPVEYTWVSIDPTPPLPGFLIFLSMKTLLQCRSVSVMECIQTKILVHILHGESFNQMETFLEFPRQQAGEQVETDKLAVVYDHSF